MNDKGEYVQISIFDILDKQTEQEEQKKQEEQTEQKPYSVCDHCKASYRFCYDCKHLEEE